jgi:hypothetical protein
MSTSTTLRLAGLVAAIAVSLSVTSSALAKPEGMTAGKTAAAQALQGRVDNPADVGSPTIQSPMVRADNPADVGTPSVGLLPAVTVSAPSNGFSWQDATLGALVGLALACIAAFAMGTLRGRRLAIRA